MVGNPDISPFEPKLGEALGKLSRTEGDFGENLAALKIFDL